MGERPIADLVEPRAELGLGGWPNGFLAVHQSGGVIVGVGAGKREIPTDVMFRPSGLGGEDEDELSPPDRVG